MRLVAIVLVLLVPSSPADAWPCWAPAVDAPVVDPFRAPACAWCPGNRGIEYGTGAGVTVRAVATGTVTFAGPVAGTTYVVIRHADGHRVTYGNLAPVGWRAGAVVARGAVVGTTAGNLHLGVRAGDGDGDDDRYVDPAGLIGTWHRRPRLVPVTGDAPNPAPAPILRCRAS